MRFRLLATALFLFALFALSGSNRADEAGNEFFEKKIRPVLVDNCFKCHSQSAKKNKGGLHVDSRAALLRGGDSGPVLAPGEPAKSRLIEAVHYKNVDLMMPPRGKLPDAAIADLTNWVKMGAPWPGGDAPAARIDDDFDLAKRKRDHWAWQPLAVKQPPDVKDGTWASSPIDRFILAKIEAKGLTPAAPADRRTLLRRVTFDLTGLPPTPEEVAAFVSDTSPEAFAKVVDRLLASPVFGERWARHWLDLVRYAESRGHEFDYTTPNAYHYRDYVIRALNADVPYDRFVTEHIAGDLVGQPRLNPDQGFNESVLGTGFWFLGEEVHSPVDTRQDEADRVDNQIDVMTKTFLGLTVSCARCHDHKFDAISTKDYYALAGFLQSSSYRLARFDSMEHNRKVAAELWKLREESRPKLGRAVADNMKPGLDRVADYLLAAQAAGLTAADKLAQVAADHKLDKDTLQLWIEQLRLAQKDDSHPLHVFAALAFIPKDGKLTEDQARAAVRQQLERQLAQRADAFARRLGSAQLVIDYSAAHPHDWLPDGQAFGPRPSQPGDLQLSRDPGKPIARVFSERVARNDSTFDGLTVMAGAENDPGALGKLVRAGRTLRTPTFELTDGRVHYLVKGAGMAYAAVDSHKMINGPLHGRVVQGIKTGPGWQWLTHDLRPYQGHKVHLEFTGTPGPDFAVAMVVQGEKAPANVTEPNDLLAGLLRGNEELRMLAESYQKLFTAAAERLGKDQLRDSVDHAALANWLVQQPGLFAVDAKKLAETATPIIAAHDKLIGDIKLESRLAVALMDGSSEDEYVFVRGTYKTPGPVAPRGLLQAISVNEPAIPNKGSGRLELARQMLDVQHNPLIARVAVNRLWHHLFGRGIVGSVDNFGVLGEKPTHPELLDYLADRFVRAGWSTKKMIRAIVLSNAYQMASTPGGEGDKTDPENLLWHRANIRRLEGEAIRDALLQLGGTLDRKLYGPSVPIHLSDFQQGRGRPASGPLDGNGRRSIYLSVRRNFLSSFLLAFDTPIPFSTVGKRTVSNVPAQALILLNDPFVHLQSERWAKRAAADKPERERITTMYLEAYGRAPTDDEMKACQEFVKGSATAWPDLAHALVNAKEFIYIR